MTAPDSAASNREFLRACRQGPTVSVGALLAAVLLLVGCASRYDLRTVDPKVDFAVHVDRYRGMVVDRMGGYEPGVVVPHGTSPSGGPDYLLEVDGDVIAALWLADSSRAIVRRATDPDARVVGTVERSSEQGAMRLRFEPSGRPEYRTGEFHRVDDAGTGPDVLGAAVPAGGGARGVYRAEVRDARGAPVGWLRVRIDTDPGATRIYDGVLPEQLDGPLAVAAVELVNADVDRLERQAQGARHAD